LLALDINKAASFTAGSMYKVVGNNTQAAFIGASAEL
jgi:hypothetical protein